MLTAQEQNVEERYAKYDQSMYTTLVDALYTPIPSLVVGGVALTATAVAVALTAWSPLLMTLSALVLAASLWRIAVVAAYGRHARREKIVASAAWERRYAVAAYLVSLAYGAFAFATLTTTGTASIDVLTVAVGVGYTSSLSGRTAARPHIVLPQVALIIVPIASALVTHGDLLSYTIGGLLVLNMLSTKGLVLAMNKTLFQAIDATHDNKVLAKRLEERNALFEDALVNTGHGLCVLDNAGNCLASNDLFTALVTGSAASIHPGQPLLSVLDEAASEGTLERPNMSAISSALDSALRDGPSGLVSLTSAGGRTVELEFRKTGPERVVAIAEDVTERRNAAAKIERLAHYDQLTGLRNRGTFNAECERVIASLPATRSRAALMSIDLDHFKEVNDALGHPVGDALLRAVAERLRDCVRDSDCVARFGGDEFLVLQHPIRGTKEAEALAKRIVETLSAPYLIGDQQVMIGASVGVAIATRDAANAFDLIKNSDLALYRAKSAGRARYAFFDESMNDAVQTRRRTELDIRRAVDRNEFELHFQPIVKLDGGGIISCEALLRWNHPARGMVGPSEFLAVAEETGAITAIGDWVLEEACKQAATWPEDISVAVNLSPVQFRFKDLVSSVKRALQKSGLSPRRLELEITESVLMQDVIDNRGTIEELVALGVSVSLDDFGTGHSSLAHLHALNLSRVKLDKSFVQDAASNPVSTAVVQSVTNIARAKGIQVVAEGIEDSDQATVVSALGCTLGQGFWYGRPVPQGEIARLIAQHPSANAA